MTPIVPAESLADVWLEVAPWIEEAIKLNGGDENSTDVLIALARGQMWLWHEKGKFAAVFQVIKLPRQTIAEVKYCGGRDLKAMQAAFEYGKTWCKQNGISVIRTFGRPGWERLLKLERTGVRLQVNL